MRIAIHISIAVFVLAGGAIADNLPELIRKGKLDEASDSLSVYSNADIRNGRVLYFQSLLETDAAESARLMEAALNARVPPEYIEDVYYRLAQYYLLQENYRDLSRVVNEYRARWETGRFEGEMQRYAVLLDERGADYETALRQADRYLLRYAKGEDEQWGLIDKARVMRSNKKPIGSEKMLRQLARENEGPGVAQALYLLADEAIRNRRIDDAVFYYNLLREEYPNAIGLDDIVDRLGGMSLTGSSDTRAEEITGTYYSVKVGVFSSKSNANDFKKQFSGYDKPIDIGRKQISGKSYHVVYVGRFQSYEDARQFKDRLEQTHGEVFQVVAR